VALLFFLTLFLSCSDGDRMRGLMEHVDSLNQCYASLADDSVMPSVVSWMDRHGTANERMRAHYLLAAVYRDRGEAPESLGELQTAAQCADTAATDCDYHTLSRVHGQMADILLNDYLPLEALQEGVLCQTNAQKANDTLMWIVAKERSGLAYFMSGDTCSAIAAASEAYELYREHKYTDEAYYCLESLLLYLIESGNIEKTKFYISMFEQKSGLYDTTAFLTKHPTYLYIKGRYLSSTGMVDSALFSFNKLKTLTVAPDYAEMAYKGLYHTYRKIGKNDSVAKYASLCYEVSDLNFQQSSKDDCRRMQAHYDYSRHQAMAFQKAKEASILRQRMTAVFSCSVILVLSAIFLAFFAIKKKRLQVEKLTEEYQLRIRQIQDAKAEIEKATFNDYMERQRAELDDGQQKLHDLLGISYVTTPVDVCSNEVYSCFMEAATHPRVKVTQTDWKRLHNLFAEKIPNFRNQLTHGKAISESDMRLCMLIRMHFTVSEICVLLDTYSQYVSNRRCQLLKKFYQIKGKAEDFDRIVSMIN
jgi:tetratricopeptide (TPR) repeat protein